MIKLAGDALADYETVAHYTLLVTVDDRRGHETTSALALQLLDVNEAPVIRNLPETRILSARANTSLVFYHVEVEDPENDTILYNISSAPAGQLFAISSTGTVRVRMMAKKDHSCTRLKSREASLALRILASHLSFVLRILASRFAS